MNLRPNPGVSLGNSDTSTPLSPLNPHNPLSQSAAQPDAIRDCTFTGQLPGCIHQLLMEAGLIGDPRCDDHEEHMQWVGETDWEYETELTLSPEQVDEDHVELVMEGLDTVARVFIDDVEVTESMSQFVPLRIDLKRYLNRRSETQDGNQPQSMKLKVQFSAPLRVIREQEQRLGARPVNGDWAPFNFMRKAACNFGWDWGPKVATVGVWGQVYLECWSSVRIDAVRPHIKQLSQSRWQVDVDVDMRIELAKSATPSLQERSDARIDIVRMLKVLLQDSSGACIAQESTVLTDEHSQRLTFEVENPALWWPRRHGGQPLYELRVEVSQIPALRDVPDHENDPECIEAQWSGKIGFRSVRLDTAADEHGRAFTFVVNDKPIFCIGANWIPPRLLPGIGRLGSASHADETFPGEHELRAALSADFNMIRIWGGGENASKEMCEFCDAHGIMIWHDFMFACAMYPEEEPFTQLVQAEAIHHVSRLAHHSSIVLWCGGNECIWGYENWGWKQRLLESQTWGAGYYFDVLPEIVQRLAPMIPYWANSPWSQDPAILPNEAMHGDRHTWDVMVDGYAATPTRFCSEFGHQSPSSVSTLQEGLGATAFAESDANLMPRGLGRRQRGPGGHERQYGEVLAAWLSPPRNAREWHYQAQMMQGRAISHAIESARGFAPLCMGSLLWQLNDVWPGLSWAIVDSQGVPKPAYFEAARAGRRRLLSFQPRDSRLALLAINDTDEMWQPKVVVQQVATTENVNARAETSLTEPKIPDGRIEARSVSIVAMLDAPSADSLLMAQAEGVRRANWWGAPDIRMNYALPRARIRLQRGVLHVEALSILRDLVLAPPCSFDMRTWMHRSFDEITFEVKPTSHVLSGHWLEPVTLLPSDLYSIQLSKGLNDVLSEHLSELCDEDGVLNRDWFMCANWFGASSTEPN